MKINYKRELEEAARTMILVHKPHTLIRLILRMVLRKVRIQHAGILLYENTRDTYVATITRGQLGAKIPAGLIRLDPHSPIIRFFTEKHSLPSLRNGALVLNKVNFLLKKKDSLAGDEDLEKLLLGIKFQMKSFDSVACVPCYYHDNLLGILMLGAKANRKIFKNEEMDFFSALASDVAMALRNAFLFEGLQLEIERNKRIFIETTMALAAAIDAKDHYTRGHTSRVTDYSLAIARKLSAERREKFSQAFFDNLHIASLLHDIGKIGIPEEILNKKGPLTTAERKKINEHTLIGAMILQPIREMDDVINAVKYHHERYDGSGYPEGLEGEQIPLISCIIAVADSYDAMTTDRPYRGVLTREEAVAEIQRCSGTQFSPTVARAAVAFFKSGGV